MSSDWELNLDRETFLAQYWQRKPLLMRGAIDKFKPPLSSHKMAGLALEEQVESRIVEQRGGDWLLHHGPITTADFERDAPWT